jgi:hypothetical protein
MRAKRAAHDFFIAQTPFSETAQKKAVDLLIVRFEFPTDSHDFNYFSHYIYYFFLSTFFSHFFPIFLKIFYQKKLRFFGAKSEQKMSSIFLSKKDKKSGHVNSP